MSKSSSVILIESATHSRLYTAARMPGLEEKPWRAWMQEYRAEHVDRDAYGFGCGELVAVGAPRPVHTTYHDYVFDTWATWQEAEQAIVRHHVSPLVSYTRTDDGVKHPPAYNAVHEGGNGTLEAWLDALAELGGNVDLQRTHHWHATSWGAVGTGRFAVTAVAAAHASLRRRHAMINN